jgi:hypothetical protein
LDSAQKTRQRRIPYCQEGRNERIVTIELQEILTKDKLWNIRHVRVLKREQQWNTLDRKIIIKEQ